MGNPRTDWMMRTDDGARPQRPLARLSARQGARRLHRDQRHDLHARPGGRLRPLAPARQCRLGLGRRAALFHASPRTTSAARPRCTAPAANGRSRASGCAGTSSKPFRDAAEEIGIPRRDDFNDGDNEGSGFFEVNQRERHPLDHGQGLPAPGAAAAQPARRDRRARHRRSSFDGKRATGVRYRVGGEPSEAHGGSARCILAAGAINSPKLLELSGIGDPDVLARTRHRRAPRARRASARTCRTICRSGRCSASPAPARSTSSPTACSARLAMALEYALCRSGPLSMAPSQLGIFSRSDATRGDARPRIPRPAAVDRQARRPAPPLPGRHRVGLQSAAREPRHRATSGARDPAEQPDDPAQLSEHRRATATSRCKAVRQARRLAGAEALAPLRARGDPARPGGRPATPICSHAIGDIATTIFHPVGTCRMGSDDRRRGRRPTCASTAVDGLRVVDASIMPTHHLGQHRLAGGDDRREGGGPDPPGALKRASEKLAGGTPPPFCLIG